MGSMAYSLTGAAGISWGSMAERDIAAEVLQGLREVKEYRAGTRTLRTTRQPCDWSNAGQRLQSAYPTLVAGICAARNVADGRGER